MGNPLTSVDTLKVHDRLTQAEMPETQARVIVDVLRDLTDNPNVATKEDVDRLENELRTHRAALDRLEQGLAGVHELIAQVKGTLKLHSWMLSVALAGQVAIFGYLAAQMKGLVQ